MQGYTLKRVVAAYLVGTTLPGLLGAGVEYFLTSGVSGIAAIPGVIIGGVVTTLILLYMNRTVESRPSQTTERSQSQSTIVPDKPPTTGESSPSQEPPAFQVDGRFFSPRTPAELVAEIEGKTGLVAQDLMKRHMGHWMRVNGQINEVEDQFPDVVVYLHKTQSQPMMALSFEPDLWKSRARLMEV